MTGPDRIWAWISNYKPQGVSLSGGPPDDTIGYIRHDPAVLAALPEVQALIRQAVEAEREACAVDAESASTPVFADIWGPRECAAVMSAMGSIAAAIRKRGEGKA